MDTAVLLAFNDLAGRWTAFDALTSLFRDRSAIKGLPIFMIFISLWFLNGPEQRERRLRLLTLIPVAMIAIVVGRFLALFLPFRLRPIHTDLDLSVPEFMNAEMLDGWSALPSDHGVVFAAITVCFWMVSRKAALIFALYSLFAIVFTRIYSGLHWPSDILVGAVVGVLLAIALVRPLARAMDRFGVFDWSLGRPEYFYPFLLVALAQLATMFDATRWFLWRTLQVIA